MKGKTLWRGVLATVIGAALAISVSGCGSTDAKSTTTAMKTIGKKASDENVVSLAVVNKTGRKITGFAIKSDDMEAYPKNMLKSGDVFAKNQQRTLYYDETDAKTAAEEAATASDETTNEAITYSLKLTFADDSTNEAQGLPLDSAELVRIRWDKDAQAAYFDYIDTATGEETNTRSLIEATTDDDDETTVSSSTTRRRSTTTSTSSSSRQGTTSTRSSTSRTRTRTRTRTNSSSGSGSSASSGSGNTSGSNGSGAASSDSGGGGSGGSTGSESSGGGSSDSGSSSGATTDSGSSAGGSSDSGASSGSAASSSAVNTGE